MQYSQTDRSLGEALSDQTALIVLHRPVELPLFIRWDEKAGLRGMRYRSQRLTRQGAMERRPAMMKISTVKG